MRRPIDATFEVPMRTHAEEISDVLHTEASLGTLIAITLADTAVSASAGTYKGLHCIEYTLPLPDFRSGKTIGGRVDELPRRYTEEDRYKPDEKLWVIIVNADAAYRVELNAIRGTAPHRVLKY